MSHFVSPFFDSLAILRVSPIRRSFATQTRYPPLSPLSVSLSLSSFLSVRSGVADGGRTDGRTAVPNEDQRRQTANVRVPSDFVAHTSLLDRDYCAIATFYESRFAFRLHIIAKTTWRICDAGEHRCTCDFVRETFVREKGKFARSHEERNGN